MERNFSPPERLHSRRGHTSEGSKLHDKNQREKKESRASSLSHDVLRKLELVTASVRNLTNGSVDHVLTSSLLTCFTAGSFRPVQALQADERVLRIERR